MPSEKSFEDRLGRGREMHAAIAFFSPAFAPADTALLPAAYNTFLDGLDTLNTDVGELVDQYTSNVHDRVSTVRDITNRAGRALSFVQSNKAWARYVRSVKSTVDKIRGNRPKKPKPPAAGESAEATKTRNQGERSYADIEGHLERLIKVVEKITDYDPPADEIKLVGLSALATSYHDLNIAMHDLSIDVALKQKDRLKAYDGPSGLKDQMTAIKKAVRAQYGTQSPEYATVKSIRL